MNETSRNNSLIIDILNYECYFPVDALVAYFCLLPCAGLIHRYKFICISMVLLVDLFVIKASKALKQFNRGWKYKLVGLLGDSGHLN